MQGALDGAIEPGVRRIGVSLPVIGKNFHQVGDRVGLLGQTLGSCRRCRQAETRVLIVSLCARAKPGIVRPLEMLRRRVFLRWRAVGRRSRDKCAACVGDDEAVVIREAAILQTTAAPLAIFRDQVNDRRHGPLGTVVRLSASRSRSMPVNPILA